MPGTTGSWLKGKESMTIEQYLRQYRNADRYVRKLEREIEKERFLIDSIRSPLGSSGEPHGTGISKSVEIRAIRIADKVEEYERAAIQAVELRQMVFDAIRNVEGIEGALLYEYYIDYFNEKRGKPKTWEDVADIIHVDPRSVYRIKKRAFKKMSVYVSI